MTKVEILHELNAAVTQIALDIFTDSVNGGLSFQDALVAVYLSGLENGQAAEKERMQ